jgi:4-amino-4-deoxy-L-arabinose transferase-like glycosyltransferase
MLRHLARVNWLTRTLGDRRRAGWLVAAALLATRLQTLFISFYNGDEANYAGHALVMLGGGLPYVGFVEKKPPLIYALYWLVFHVAHSLPLVHAVTIVLVGATAWLLERQLRLFLPQLHASLGALYYVLFSASFMERDVLATNCEVVMNLPAAAAGWALLRAARDGRRWLWWSGLFTGLAFLVKHQAGIGLLVIALYLLLGWRGLVPLIADGLAVLCGFALPSLAVVALYAALHRLPELYEWNVLTNLTYLGPHMPPAEEWSNAAVTTLSFVGANLLPFAGAAAALKLRAKAPELVRFHALWLVACALPISMGGRFYGHYYVQAYPPLCALAAVAGGEWLERRAEISRAARALFVAALFVPALFWQGFALVRTATEGYEGAYRFHRAVGAAVAAASSPGDEIFVWGNYAYPYYFADRRPATRYIVCEYVLPFWEVYLAHRSSFDDADIKPWHRSNYRLLIEDLRAHRPRVIVDTSTSPRFKSWAPFPFTRFPELDAFVRADYEVVASVEGVTILRRRSP